MRNLSDEQLVERYLKGEQAALDFLIERYLKRVYNFVAKLIGRGKETEDLTQDIFFKVWRNLKKFKPDKSFRVWLFSIARNRSIDYLRRKKALVFSELDNEEDGMQFSDTLVDKGESVIDRISKEELAKDIEGYLAGLSEANRTVLILRYNQQMTFREIAELLGEPLDTVKSRHRRALGYLKRVVEKTKR